MGVLQVLILFTFISWRMGKLSVAMVAGDSSLHDVEVSNSTTIQPTYYPVLLPCLLNPYECGMEPFPSKSRARRSTSTISDIITSIFIIFGDLAQPDATAASLPSTSIPVLVFSAGMGLATACRPAARLLLLLQEARCASATGDGDWVATSVTMEVEPFPHAFMRLAAEDPCGRGWPHLVLSVIHSMVGPGSLYVELIPCSGGHRFWSRKARRCSSWKVQIQLLFAFVTSPPSQDPNLSPGVDHTQQPSFLLMHALTKQLLLWSKFDDSASNWVLGSSFYYFRQRRQQYLSDVGMFLPLRWLHRPSLNRRSARSVHLGARVFDASAYTPHWQNHRLLCLSRRCCLFFWSEDRVVT